VAVGASSGRLSGPLRFTHRRGAFSYDRSRFRDCAPAPRALGRSRPPLLVGGTHLGNPGAPAMTVFGILAPAGVSEVRVAVSGGARAGSVSAPLVAIRPRAAPASRLRFAVVVLRGTRCVERLATRSASGRPLWDGAPAEHGCEYTGPVVG
jgi:hypothetical protein